MRPSPSFTEPLKATIVGILAKTDVGSHAVRRKAAHWPFARVSCHGCQLGATCDRQRATLSFGTKGQL